MCSSSEVTKLNVESVSGEGRSVTDSDLHQLDIEPGVASVLVEGR